MSTWVPLGPVWAGLCLAALCGLGSAALAQEPPPDAPAAPAPAEAETPKPRPKRRPPTPRRDAKPVAPKAAPAGVPVAASVGQGTAEHGMSEQGKPEQAGADRSAAAETPPVRAPRSETPKSDRPTSGTPKAGIPKSSVAKAVAPTTSRDRAPAAAPPAPAVGVPVPPAAAPTVPLQATAPTAQPPASVPPTPATLSSSPLVAPEPPSACEGRAALYDGEKGFAASVTRLGRVQVENPLRPLTPEVTRVLQLTIAGKVATAYGPDLAALRRGGPPAVLESQLGGGIRWEPALPLLPETLTIVAETGETLARLAFRACTEAPATKVSPAEARARDRKPAGRRPTAADAPPKTPPGFRLPQGAIAE